jgi:hypothetical protein
MEGPEENFLEVLFGTQYEKDDKSIMSNLKLEI